MIVQLEVKRSEGIILIHSILIAQCPQCIQTRAYAVGELRRELMTQIIQRILRLSYMRSIMTLLHIEVVEVKTTRCSEEGEIVP